MTVFDDGNHSAPTPHAPAFSGMLIFTPGALLRNGRGHTPADWNETTAPDGQLSTEGYYSLYRRRLLPVFRYINDRTTKLRSGFLTVPGLGCGQFAGPFRGQLGTRLQTVLQRLLTEYGASFPNLKAVYFDPYSECENGRREIHGISFMVRPLRVPGNQAKSQLCRPLAYAEQSDDFSACALYSIVAWDHVSWPGNDFFIGSRATGDGVKAAATSSIHAASFDDEGRIHVADVWESHEAMNAFVQNRLLPAFKKLGIALQRSPFARRTTSKPIARLTRIMMGRP